MAGLCAHMGASLAGKAIATRGAATKKLYTPVVVCRSAAVPSRAGATVRGRAGSVAGAFGEQTGAVKARGMRRGEVRAANPTGIY
jgi:hypothetical protein